MSSPPCPQALIVSPEEARRYETLSVDPGSAIAADMQVAEGGEFLYVLSTQKVSQTSLLLSSEVTLWATVPVKCDACIK